MSDLMKHIAKLAFYAMAILIIGWTGMHTYDILWATNPLPEQQYLAVYGLLVFEGGTLVWFFAFLKNAEGLGQHAIALIGTVVGALLVMTAFILDYMVPRDQIMSYSSMARWAVILATAVDFAFVLLYELFNPHVWEELQDNLHVANLIAKADRKANQLIEKDSDELADKLAQNRKARAYARAELAGIKTVPIITNKEAPAAPTPPAPDILDRLKELVAPEKVKNNGHVPAEREEQGGQGGARPNG